MLLLLLLWVLDRRLWQCSGHPFVAHGPGRLVDETVHPRRPGAHVLHRVQVCFSVCLGGGLYVNFVTVAVSETATRTVMTDWLCFPWAVLLASSSVCLVYVSCGLLYLFYVRKLYTMYGLFFVLFYILWTACNRFMIHLHEQIKYDRECNIMALVYINRITTANNMALTVQNWRLLWLLAVMVAQKVSTCWLLFVWYFLFYALTQRHGYIILYDAMLYYGAGASGVGS